MSLFSGSRPQSWGLQLAALIGLLGFSGIKQLEVFYGGGFVQEGWSILQLRRASRAPTSSLNLMIS